MKTKFIFILIALASMMSARFAYGQETNFKAIGKDFVNIAALPVHQQFKSTEICGSAADFSAKLSKQGFTPSTKYANNMTGIFAGYEVSVVYETTPLSKQVFRVIANLPTRQIWSNVENDYATFKANLTTKYGEPKTVNEKFWDPYRKGDGYELKALGSNKVQYVCDWVTPNGHIQMKILGDEQKCYLKLIYTDNAGIEQFNKEKEEQFLQDL